MTGPVLLAWMGAAVLVQLGSAVLWAWVKHPKAVGVGLHAPPSKVEPVALGAWEGLRAFRVQHRQYEDAHQSQCSFHLAPVDPAELPPYLPGQYLTLSLTLPDTRVGAAGEPRTVTRCYSLSDAPGRAVYRLTVKRVGAPPGTEGVPPGAASNFLHDHVAVGDVVQCRAPAGQFVLDPDPSVPVVLAAGGVGITPLMSMLVWSLEHHPQRPVHLYYGLHHPGDHVFRDTLQALATAHPSFHLHVVYGVEPPAQTPDAGQVHQGHVDVELLRRTLPAGRHQFYVCGPLPMMNALLPALRGWGVAEADIHHEAFGPGLAVNAVPQPAPKESIRVEFSRSMRTLWWDGSANNLLDFAEQHDVQLDSGCRSGSCGSCAVKVMSGNVGYPQPPDHRVAAGSCLMCSAYPKSALVLDA